MWSLERAIILSSTNGTSAVDILQPFEAGIQTADTSNPLVP
jgi:hypothetical protein